MHSCCADKTCKCVCHQICARCGNECQATYDASQVVGVPEMVCADCYVIATKDVKRSRCEGCGATTAFRDPSLGNHYYCMDCHKQRVIEQSNPLAG